MLEIGVVPINIFEDCGFQGGNISVIQRTKNFTELGVVSRNKLLSAPGLDNEPVNKNNPPSLSSLVSMSLFSMSASLFLFCK